MSGLPEGCLPVPNVQVELGLQKAFLLDDPIAGEIGNTTYVLDGQDFVDISEYVFGVSISRGKNRDLDKYVAGSVDVELRNHTRAFDPKYASSPFINDLVPRRGIRVSIDSVPAFTGKVTDWNLSYNPGGESIAQVSGLDAFSLLATQFLTAGTAVAEQTGARINRVLNMASVNWPSSDRLIDTGLAQVGLQVFDGSEEALGYLQEVELSEGGGNLFISKQGYIEFVDRSVSPATSDAIVFADDGTGIPFTALDVEYGSENLYNVITVTSPYGTAIASDSLSQTNYGISALDVSSLVSTQAQAESLADFLLKRYKNPEYRFRAVTVNVDSLTDVQRAAILSMELGAIAQVKFTPNGISPGLDVYNLVIRIDHSVSIDRHDVTIGLGAVQSGVFVIGDPVFGTIGEDAIGVLGF
jgi:hypothetical protein